MSFLLIAIIAIAALGLVAALTSIGGDDTPIVENQHDCGSCTSHDDGSCKIACLMEEAKKRKAEKARKAGKGEEGNDEDDADGEDDANENDDKGNRTAKQHKIASHAKGKGAQKTLLLLIACSLWAGCSTQKNNSTTRSWHAFHARYNTYFNASQAFMEGCDEQDNGNRDDYTQLLPLYSVGNKDSRSLGSGLFDRSIEKSEKAIQRHSIKRRPEWNKQRRKTKADIEWLNRREYNPFLWRAWLLLGKSQFRKGEFEEAAATFGYMARLYNTQPVILARARAWQAKSYAEMGWLYEAEDVITHQQRDTIPWQAKPDWDYTLADFYLRSGQYDKSVDCLRRSISHERRHKRRARLWYLMGQVETLQGHHKEAYKAYQHTIRLNPPYELEFHARIALSEVMADKDSKGTIRKLRRMARSDKNKDFLDQVYYAIGNIYLTQRDTLHAIESYEEGRKRATQERPEKGTLLLQLGHLYWDKEQFSEAKDCYEKAIGLISAERKDYNVLKERSQWLDELAPHTDAIVLQDSLLKLAAMPEHERLRIIDGLIAKRKKEDRERELAEMESAQGNYDQKQTDFSQSNKTNTTGRPSAANDGKEQAGTWYFYNPQAVRQGIIRFEQLWGKRANEDNWQRSNLTVVPTAAEETAENEVASLQEQTQGDNQSADSTATSTDPYSRTYYLAQIPFTEEQQQEAHKTIRESLLRAAIVLKDKIGNRATARRMLQRLLNTYPNNEANDLALYHLYLMEAREGRKTQADEAVKQLKEKFPDSEWTKLLSDPYYAENQRYGGHLEDSLYAATYNAFRAERYQEVFSNTDYAGKRFPQGAHRPKFLFIEGLGRLNNGQADSCIARMKDIVGQYPQSEVTELAGHILRGIQQGRRLQGASLSISDLWHQYNDSTANDSLRQDTLSVERDVKYAFMLAYQPDSVNQNQLLYELARYNFTSFLVRNFDIDISSDGPIQRMTITGFLSYDEALQYAHKLYATADMAEKLKGCRRIIISENNIPLLGTAISYEDYDAFYQETLAPVKIEKHPLLNRPATIVEQPGKTTAEGENQENDNKLEEAEEDTDNTSNHKNDDFDDDFYW